jgi:hypothetical protein
VMLINPSIRAVQGKYEENGNAETFKTTDQDLRLTISPLSKAQPDGG